LQNQVMDAIADNFSDLNQKFIKLQAST